MLCVWFGFLKKKPTHKTTTNWNKQKQNQEKNPHRFRKRKKWNPTGLMFPDDKAEGNHLIPSMKAAQKDKMQRSGKKISLDFLHWHEMAAFLVTASSHASCWHYTSCAVDPPPCWCLPNRIISCVTAVVAELLALQIPEHHFNASHMQQLDTLPDILGWFVALSLLPCFA